MRARNLDQGRFVFPDERPISRSGGYVPTLTQRSSDLDALTRLDPATRRLITPYIRVVRFPGTSGHVTADRLDDWARAIGRAVGGSPCYVELAGFDPVGREASGRGRRQRPIVHALMEQLQRKGQRPIPTIPVHSRSPEQLAILTTVAHGTTSGVALRVVVSPYADPRDLVQAARQTAVDLRESPEQIDILIEEAAASAGSPATGDLVAFIDRLKADAPWRTIILLGSDLPDRIKAPREATLLTVGRPSWRNFLEIRSRLDDGLLRFGDFGIRHPSRLVDPATARANIRITVDDHHLLAVGRLAMNGLRPPSTYARLCSDIFGHELFGTATPCEACRWIALGATSTHEIPALQDEWDTMGLVHHMTQVVNQLRVGVAR